MYCDKCHARRVRLYRFTNTFCHINVYRCDACKRDGMVVEELTAGWPQNDLIPSLQDLEQLRNRLTMAVGYSNELWLTSGENRPSETLGPPEIYLDDGLVIIEFSFPITEEAVFGAISPAVTEADRKLLRAFSQIVCPR